MTGWGGDVGGSVEGVVEVWCGEADGGVGNKDTVYKKIGRLPMHHNKIVTPVTVANA